MTVRRRQISSRACRSAICVSKAVIDYLVQQKVLETLVSEIVRPSPEAAEVLRVSAPVAPAEFALMIKRNKMKMSICERLLRNLT